VKLIDTQPPTIVIGVSACLLGQKVRYDGKHTIDSYLTGVLGRFFELLAVCPEAEAGMGIPREPVHLEVRDGATRFIGNTSQTDQTAPMERFLARRLPELARAELCGCVLKTRSPSCGLRKVPVVVGGRTRPGGSGLFAAALRDRLPLLPLEDEVGLRNPLRRRRFINQAIGYAQLRELFRGRPGRRRFAAFRQWQENRIRAHSPRHWRQLTVLHGRRDELTPAEFRQRYRALFLTALGLRRTRVKSISVLRRIAKPLRRLLSPAEAASLDSCLQRYRAGHVPLAAPRAVLLHLLEIHRPENAMTDAFLLPDPREEALL